MLSVYLFEMSSQVNILQLVPERMIASIPLHLTHSSNDKNLWLNVAIFPFVIMEWSIIKIELLKRWKAKTYTVKTA